MDNDFTDFDHPDVYMKDIVGGVFVRIKLFKYKNKSIYTKANNNLVKLINKIITRHLLKFYPSIQLIFPLLVQCRVTGIVIND